VIGVFNPSSLLISGPFAAGDGSSDGKAAEKGDFSLCAVLMFAGLD
jgi:hypothetical protein